MELLKGILSKVKGQLVALNQEFAGKNMKWTILDSTLVDQKLKVIVQLDKQGELITENFIIWRRDEHSYYFRNENESEPRVMLKDLAFKTIAMEVYGGQIVGTSLVDEDWGRKHFKHLNRVAAT